MRDGNGLLQPVQVAANAERRTAFGSRHIIRRGHGERRIARTRQRRDIRPRGSVHHGPNSGAYHRNRIRCLIDGLVGETCRRGVEFEGRLGECDLPAVPAQRTVDLHGSRPRREFPVGFHLEGHGRVSRVRQRRGLDPCRHAGHGPSGRTLHRHDVGTGGDDGNRKRGFGNRERELVLRHGDLQHFRRSVIRARELHLAGTFRRKEVVVRRERHRGVARSRHRAGLNPIRLTRNSPCRRTLDRHGAPVGGQRRVAERLGSDREDIAPLRNFEGLFQSVEQARYRDGRFPRILVRIGGLCIVGNGRIARTRSLRELHPAFGAADLPSAGTPDRQVIFVGRQSRQLRIGRIGREDKRILFYGDTLGEGVVFAAELDGGCAVRQFEILPCGLERKRLPGFIAGSGSG